MSTGLACTKCKSPLPPEFANSGRFEACPKCASPLRVEIFPAFFRVIERGKLGEALAVESDASCYYHEGKKASEVCAGCGRFICSLCAFELEGSHLCPACLEAAQKKGKAKNLQNQRILYDSTALTVILVSFVIPFLSFVAAPVSLYLAIRHWNSPRSLLHRTKARLVAAIIVSSMVILIWILVICYFLFR